ncbi:PLP-dependent aminotransferase family protein [Pseudonocardia sp. GCM10023141]|uniref:MocR-like pyridoxine biosynthesis transcription factor PdxR n=1 Tax=Pseudonocardia sp. GCM10023141 TaxID=3252653 RepID=UPI00361B36E7
MPVGWSSDVDLHLGVTAPIRTALDLSTALRAAVRDGRLAAGATLPSTRVLAGDLGLARGTVTAAYGQLAAEGFLEVHQGSPTRVADVDRVRPEPVPPAGPRPAWQMRHNLMPGMPDVSAFPRDSWLTATRRVLATTAAEQLGYPHPLGHPVLRAALAAYLGRARGVLADPSTVVIGPGFSALLTQWAAVLGDHGVDAVTFEDPSVPHLRAAVRSAGLTVTAARVDEAGVRTEDIGSPAVVLTPAHQFPMGVTLAPSRRGRLARQAGAQDLHVLEDDYDGEFRFDRGPVGALQALAPAQVTYAGTASKALAPGLRLAWLVVPPRLLPALGERMALRSTSVPVLDQLVLADLITSGAYDKHVRRMRNRYRTRRDAVVATAAAHGLAPAGIAAGLHLLLPTADGGERAAAAAARRHGLGIDLLARYRLAHDHPDGLLVGYAAPADHAFGPALRALDAVLGEVSPR